MTVDLADVAIAWEGETHVFAAFDALLRDRPRSQRAPDLRIEVRAGSVEPLSTSQFFFDDLRGRQDESCVEIGNDHVHARIDASSVVVTASSDAPAERVAALCMIFALARRGIVHIHAAVLATERGTVLLAGGSGSGKSSSTIALLRAGARYLADDAVFAFRRAGTLRLCALPSAFHVLPSTAAYFPELAMYLREVVHGDKRRLDDLRAFAGQRVEEAAPPFALLFPRVVGDRTVVSPLGRAEALGRLLEASAWCALPGAPDRRAHLDVLAELVDGALAGDLLLAPDVLEEPQTLAARILSL